MRNLIRWTLACIAVLGATPIAHADDDRAGLYTSISGLWVIQQDGDVTVDGTDVGEFEFDDGLGASVALGFDLPGLPISIEGEYTYRDTESETLNITGLPVPIGFEADLGSHAFMVNGLVNFQIGETPFGIYGGGGVGYVLTTVDLASVAGLPVDDDEDDFTFAYQLRGGLTFEVTDDILLFGGVRWFSTEEPDFDGIEVENESLNLEFGLRLHF